MGILVLENAKRFRVQRDATRLVMPLQRGEDVKRSNDSMVERPGPDATSAEIARSMEEDFGEALAEGMKQATGEDENDENDE